jgi:hypothetical protein
LILTTTALALSACSTGRETTSGARAQSHPGQGVSSASATIPGDAPVDVEIRIDRTAILHGSKALAEAYKTAALRGAELSITRGGTLSVSLFGRSSSQALAIFPATHIASLRQKGYAARGADNQNYRNRLAAALDLSLGLRAAEGLDREELERVTARAGSDVIRAVSKAMAQVSSGTAPYKIVLIVSDGYNDQEDFVLRRLIVHPLTDRQIDRAAVKMLAIANVPDGTAVTQLRIIGIGRTSGRIDRQTPELEHLEQIWDGFCQKLPVEDCQADAAL